MDVSDKISEQNKSNLKAVFSEFQMCQGIVNTAQVMLEGRKQIMQTLMNQTLKDELHVDPKEYTLGVDVQRDMWDLKRKDEPEAVATTPVEVPKAIPEAIDEAKKNRDALISKALRDRTDAQQKVEAEYKRAEEEANKKFESETAKALGK